MKRLIPILVAIVISCVWTVPVLAGAPDGAVLEAQNGLEKYKELVLENPSLWGLSVDEVKRLRLGESHQLVAWDPALPLSSGADAVIRPVKLDTWVFRVLNEGKPVMQMRVVRTDEAWKAARLERLSSERASALDDIRGLTKAKGLSKDSELQLFTFRGMNFWYLPGKGTAFLYPVMEESHPAMAALGLSRKDLHMADDVLKKLNELPIGEEPGSGGGSGLPYRGVGLGTALAILGSGMLLSGLGVYWFLRRAQAAR